MTNISEPAEDCNRNPAASSKNAAFTASTLRGASNGGGKRSSQTHGFSKTLAEMENAKGEPLGWHAAIILRYLAFMVRKYGEESDGKQWVRINLDHIKKRYSYLGRSTVDESIARLMQRGCCETKNLNQKFGRPKYDRTRWYHVPQEWMDAAEEEPRYFDSGVAGDVKVVAATIYHNFCHWIGECREQEVDERVRLRPEILVKLLPFSKATIKRGIRKLIDAGYILPVHGMECWYAANNEMSASSKADKGGSKADKGGSNPDKGGSKADNDSSCNVVVDELETCSKGQASPSLCEHSSGDTNNICESVHSSQASTDADGQGGIGMCHEEDTVSPTVPFNDDIQDCVSDVNIEWPAIDSYKSLHSINKINSGIVLAIEKDVKARDLFLATARDICDEVMLMLDPAVVEKLHYDCNEDEVVATLLPIYQQFLSTTHLDRSGFLFDVIYYGVFECLVGAFLWPEACGDSYSHPMLLLIRVTHEVYLMIWKYFEDIRVKEVEAEFAQRRIEFASADEHKENDTTLAPAEKTRVFRNGLNARNQVGWIFYDQQHRMGEITGINKRSLGLVQKLFVHNPQLSPAQVLSIMDQVMNAYAGQPKPMDPLPYEGWYPPKGIQWHARRAHNLMFFITNLHTVVAQLNLTTPIENYLRDVKAAEQGKYEEEDLESMAA